MPRQHHHHLLLILLLALLLLLPTYTLAFHLLPLPTPSPSSSSSPLLFAFFPQRASPAAPPQAPLTFRRGTSLDGPLISQSMCESRMNPLFLLPENFLVGETQIGGDVKVAGFGQIRPVAGSSNAVFELASVYVLPEARNQGVGSQIVAALVQEFLAGRDEKAEEEEGKRRKKRLVLLTLADTAPFYTPHGFSILPNPTKAGLPPLLVCEFLAGSVVARLSRGAGTKLVCMELLL